MRLSRGSLVLPCLLVACAQAGDIQAPRPQRLPTSWDLAGIGRLALDEPLRNPEAQLLPDSMGIPYRVLPRDDWYLLEPAPASGFTRVYVWVRHAGTIGCVIAWAAPPASYPELVAEYEHRFGPRLLEETQGHPVGRWSVWADAQTIWSVVGPKEGYKAALSVELVQREPTEDPTDPTDPSYVPRCTEGRRQPRSPTG